MIPGLSAMPGGPAGAGKPWRCVLAGTESLLVECATILIDRGHEVVAVLSGRDTIQDWARSRAIPLSTTSRELLDLELSHVDYLFSITNLTILSQDLLALPRLGAINFHDGPLPAYSGLNAPIWALLNGETHHAVTWHVMTEAVDGGAILATRAFDVDPSETGLSINTKCFVAGIESFTEMLDGLEEGSRRSRKRTAGRPIMALLIDPRR